MTVVKSISKKDIISQTTLLKTDDTWALDTSDGISAGRFETERSYRRDIRRLLVTNSDNTVRVQTTAGVAMAAVVGLTAGSATNAQIVNAVNNAITSANVSTTQHLGTSGSTYSSSISFLDMLSDVSFVLGNGTICVDDVGILLSTNVRVKPNISLREAVRRVCRVNSTGSTIRLQTASGLIINAIGAAGTVTAAGLVTAAQAAISASTSTTVVATISAQIPARSELEIFNRLVVEATGNVLALDDTGETVAARAPKTLNLKNVMRNLTSGTSGLMFRTTSGMKVNAVGALTAGTATSAQIQTAITTAI